MQATNEMIEKYKREMQQMFAKSNQSKPAVSSNLPPQQPAPQQPAPQQPTPQQPTPQQPTPQQPAPPQPRQQARPRLDDFPQFQNSGDELTRRIEEILRQNSDVALESDKPSGFNPSPPQITTAPGSEPSYEDDAGALEEMDNSTETRQQIASRTCIRGGAMAKYSPPANTGSSISGQNGTTPPLTDTADLIVEVFAANRAIPIENAQIRIKNPDDDSILAVLETNEDGRTSVINLSAPDRNLSLQPQFPNPFVNYFADIRADGYVPQSDIRIQLFGGQKSLLPANMIPREEI